MGDLNVKLKVRGITKDSHPAEIAEFFRLNADRIKQAVVIVDYEDDGKIRSHERYCGNWTNSDLAWWIACLQSTLMKQM